MKHLSRASESRLQHFVDRHDAIARKLDDALQISHANVTCLACPRVTPRAAQVDMFLCSSGDCTYVADLMYVHASGGPAKPTFTLAYGYSRISGTVVGMPVKHISAADLRDSVSKLDEGKVAGVADGARVSWGIKNPQWVHANPVMLSFGACERQRLYCDGPTLLHNVGCWLLGVSGHCIMLWSRITGQACTAP
jgi:hypothetical protein